MTWTTVVLNNVFSSEQTRLSLKCLICVLEEQPFIGFVEPGFTASNAMCYVLENIPLAQNSQLIVFAKYQMNSVSEY